MSFTDDEIAYLQANPMGHLASVSASGQPDAVLVAVEFDGAVFWVGGGSTVTRTRKFRNVAAGNHQVSLVIDDMPSFDPFIARGIRIYGHAEQPFEREGMIGPDVYMRIVPTVSWSWNLAGEPALEKLRYSAVWLPGRELNSLERTHPGRFMVGLGSPQQPRQLRPLDY